jgi:hypothetical protein
MHDLEQTKLHDKILLGFFFHLFGLHISTLWVCFSSHWRCVVRSQGTGILSAFVGAEVWACPVNTWSKQTVYLGSSTKGLFMYLHTIRQRNHGVRQSRWNGPLQRWPSTPFSSHFSIYMAASFVGQVRTVRHKSIWAVSASSGEDDWQLWFGNRDHRESK